MAADEKNPGKSGSAQGSVKIKKGAPEAVQKALTDPAIPKLYANGFGLGMTNADIHIVLMQYGQPTTILNMSYTLAKTLSLRLGRLVAEWETKTGQQLATTDKIDLAFAKTDSDETPQ